MDNRPIGVFDSGLGGLTVVKELKKILPDESIIYFGDTARLPYGVKSKSLIKQYSIQIIKFLSDKKAKVIVIACNTATAMALEELRSKFYDISIIGVINAGSNEAIMKTKNKKVGVIGTIATISSNAYEIAIKEKDSSISIISKACPLFVPFVEEGLTSGNAIDEIAANYLSVFNNNIDTLILGCTHYPLLKKVISNNINNINLIDSASAIATKVFNQLKNSNSLNNKSKQGSLDCYVTDLPMRFKELGKTFLSEDIKNIHLIDEF